MPDTIAGLALILGSVVFVAAAILIRHHKTPTSARPAAQPPRAEVGTKGQCTQSGCGYPASAWVVVADDLGGGVRHVCKGCHDEGLARKWWRLSLGSNPTALDFEIADDLDRLEQLANGGDVA